MEQRRIRRKIIRFTAFGIFCLPFLFSCASAASESSNKQEDIVVHEKEISETEVVIPVSENSSEKEAKPVVAEDEPAAEEAPTQVPDPAPASAPKKSIPISTATGNEPPVDGGQEEVEPDNSAVMEIFIWLKEELKKEEIILTGEQPERVWSQVVSGFKYNLLCEYETVDGERKLLSARIFHRSDGVRIIQKILLEIEE